MKAPSAIAHPAGLRWLGAVAGLGLVLIAGAASAAEITTPPGDSLSGNGLSVLRVFGGLVFVLALFLGVVWLLRNWQRAIAPRGQLPKLNVLEAKSLGNRNTLYVVGYEQQRLLVSSSPTGVTLVSHLPNAELGEPAVPVPPSFAEALQQVLTRK